MGQLGVLGALQLDSYSDSQSWHADMTAYDVAWVSDSSVLRLVPLFAS